MPSKLPTKPSPDETVVEAPPEPTAGRVTLSTGRTIQVPDLQAAVESINAEWCALTATNGAVVTVRSASIVAYE